MRNQDYRLSWVGRISRWFSPLEFGAFGPLAIRRESVCLGLRHPVRLLYASDLHLGHWWTRNVPAQLLNVSRRTRPDIILLGGDLTDRRTALGQLHACIRVLTALAPVAAIPGNHDERVGVPDLRA